MTEHESMSLREARRNYLATRSTSVPVAGLICWATLALGYFLSPAAMPSWSAFAAAAGPIPVAMLIDKALGRPTIQLKVDSNPVGRLFGQFIIVVGLMAPLVIIAANAMESIPFLILGMAILAGLVWVPHGWAADDPAGLIHFVLRAILCYAAYLFSPEPYRVAAIAGAAALTYVYAIAAMKKPASVR